MKFDSNHLLTSSEVGELLQVNPSSVKKWIDAGRLAAFRTPGGHRRVRAADLVQFLDTHGMFVPEHLRTTLRRRLLIVDDDVSQLKALARLFNPWSDWIEIATSANGIDALVLIGSFRPQIVLLDVFMPGVDGLEVCRRLKANPHTPDVGVVIASSHMTPELSRRGLEAGAITCANKPVDVTAIAALVLERPILEARAP